MPPDTANNGDGYNTSPAGAGGSWYAGYDDEDDASWRAAEAAASDAAIAARDDEPASDTLTTSRPDAPDPFALEIEAAKVELQVRLGAAKSVRTPMFMQAGDIFREYEATRWLITGVVATGGVGLIAAEPKTGKTWAATEIAIAVATGTRAFGEFFAEKGVVAYFYAEDDARSVRNRIRALMVGRNLDAAAPADLYVCPRGQFIDVTKDDDLAWVIASARRVGPLSLLVLDPLRDISSAAEDKSDEMRDVMRRMRLVGEVLGCTVVLMHHTTKLGADTKGRRPGARMRGSSAIHGSTDSGLYLEYADGDGRSHFEVKATSEIKSGRSAGEYVLSLDVVDDEGGEAVQATYTTTREATKPKSKRELAAEAKARKEVGDDDAVFEFVRTLAMRGDVLSRRALRSHEERPVAEGRTEAALDRLIESGRLVLAGPKVRLPGAS